MSRKKLTRIKYDPKNRVFCNPDVCENCQYIGEGDSVCLETQNVVLSDWQPTDDYMKDCPLD